MQYPIIDAFAEAYLNNGWTGINIPATITYTPIQLGSGDPSPDNIRPILPATTLNIGGIDTPIYGGSLDVATGVLTLTRVTETFTWSNGSNATDLGSYTRKYFNLLNTPIDALLIPEADLSNVAPMVVEWASDSLHFYINGTNARAFVYLPNDTDNDTQIQICYHLATPTTVQLTLQELGKALSLDKDISYRLKLPMQHYFPHPVIDALQAAAAGTQTAEQTEVLRHYLTPLGIGGI